MTLRSRLEKLESRTPPAHTLLDRLRGLFRRADAVRAGATPDAELAGLLERVERQRRADPAELWPEIYVVGGTDDR